MRLRSHSPHDGAPGTSLVLPVSSTGPARSKPKTFPSDDDCHALVANLQFPAIRDRLIADIPGLDEPMQQILFAQTDGTPKWSRIEWAQQLLLHACTRTSPEHAAPVLTTIGYINWWEGRGSKAHQYLLTRPALTRCR